MKPTDNVIPLRTGAQDDEALQLEAAEWLMRLSGDDVPAALHAGYAAWRAQSDAHGAAADQLAAIWTGMDCLEEANHHAAAPEVVEARAATTGRPVAMDRRMFGALAASLVVAVGAGVVWRAQGGGYTPYAASYETALGEQARIDLPDGSVINLNTHSHIEVTYSKGARQIQLRRGEAFFDVAPNKRRPFSVHAGEGVVRAVGTAFAVRLHEAKLDVLVSEGRVALATTAPQRPDTAPGAGPDRTPDPAPLVELSAGQAATFARKVDQIAHVPPAAMARRLAWRDGVLSFSGEPLSAVIADLSRYTATHIEIADADLAALPISGHLKVGDLDGMFSALQVMADIEVDRVSDARVRLLPAEKAAAPKINE